MSDDGRFTVVIIALLGNPFSPAYARARARGGSRALDHCALHVALEGPGLKCWSLHERAMTDGARRPRAITLGSSHIAWSDEGFSLHVHERTTPGGRPLTGRVLLRPECAPAGRVPLDDAGDHGWWPVAPLAHAEVDFREPAVRFRGHGYADANAGRVPIEAGFRSWSWSRARVERSRAVVAYDVVDRAGRERARTMIFQPSGAEITDRIARSPLAASRWGLSRRAYADPLARATLVRGLEDGPSYARSLIGTRLLGKEVTAMHEVLSADRLRRAWVRFLLGFRMGRAR